MKTKLIQAVKLLCMITIASTGLSSCAAGRVDRVEDRVDRRHYSGPLDRREDINDKFRGRRGLMY